MSDKTEEPTPKRLHKAREEGDSGVSTQAAQAVAFLVAVALAPAAIGALAATSTRSSRRRIARAGDATPQPPIRLCSRCRSSCSWFRCSLAAGAAQRGRSVRSDGRVRRDEEALAEARSAERLLRFQEVVLVDARSSRWCARSSPGRSSRTSRTAACASTRRTWRTSRGGSGSSGSSPGRWRTRVCRDAALFGIAVGAVDLLVTRRAWMKRLRMSKDEVKREYKESEGDPQLKAARERAHHEMLASATVGEREERDGGRREPDAHRVRAPLRRGRGRRRAAVLVAVGEGDLAQRIVEAAHAYGIPVLRDVPLARALVELDGRRQDSGRALRGSRRDPPRGVGGEGEGRLTATST